MREEIVGREKGALMITIEIMDTALKCLIVDYRKKEFDLFDGSKLISQLRFLLPQQANRLPKTPIPPPRFNYEEASQDHKEYSDA